MYHMIRKPQQNPMPQVGRRFNALYSTVRPGVQPPTVDLDPVIDFKDAASWLSTKGLDAVILNALLTAENHETVGPTGKAFIAQIRLISAFAEMTPYLTMKAFVSEGLSKASLLAGVGSEIKAFIEAERALRQQHGDALFPYLRALRLQALAPVNFPNLCKVANTRKRRTDGTFRDYKSTKESLSTLTDREVEDAVFQPPIKKKTLSSADADGLKFAFSATDQEISGATSDENQSPMPQNLETALLALTEALKRK